MGELEQVDGIGEKPFDFAQGLSWTVTRAQSPAMAPGHGRVRGGARLRGPAEAGRGLVDGWRSPWLAGHQRRGARD